MTYLTGLGVGAVLLAGLFLRPQWRVGFALALVSLGFSLYAAEVALSIAATRRTAASQTFWPQEYDAATTARILRIAAEHGVEFDSRTKRDVVLDLRRMGIDAVPNIPRTVFVREPAAGGTRAQIAVGDQVLLPLGGISNRVTVLCNESGAYVVYTSDEHGFHNPTGMSNADQLHTALIGDSYAEGMCVPSDSNFASVVRRARPRTLNLGVSGTGPLFQLATLKEYLGTFRPPIVLWFYFEQNDLTELASETRHPVLRKYLTQGFTQGLIDLQPHVDRELASYVEAELATNVRAQGKSRSMAARFADALFRPIRLSHLRALLGLAKFEAWRETELAQMEAQLDLFYEILIEARRTVEAWGGTLFFIYLPGRDRYANNVDFLRDQALEVAHSAGLQVVDMHEVFQASSDPLGLFPFRRFGHYNSVGHRLVGETVLSAIADYESAKVSTPQGDGR